jgi:hypothetical protein
MITFNSFNDLTSDWDIQLQPSMGDTFDILPVGSSPVSDPSFYMTENGKVNTWRSYARSYDDALDDAFSAHAWPGGYDLLYFTDGDIVCADCAREHWIATGIRLEASTAGDNRGTGTYCGACEREIIARCCADCGDEEDDDRFHSPAFGRISGDVQICARCMAQHVVDGTAWKTGKGTYDIELNGPWYGGGTYTTYR